MTIMTMFQSHSELFNVPEEFQKLGMRMKRADPTMAGVFRLVDVHWGGDDLGVHVIVLDENGAPVNNVRVAYHFDTAPDYTFAGKWSPGLPRNAHFDFTTWGTPATLMMNNQGIIGSGDDPNWPAVCVLEPNWSSDIVYGVGIGGDHAGLTLVYQLNRTGYRSVTDIMTTLTGRMENVAMKMESLID